MIPIKPQTEPSNFDKKVRIPGKAFLALVQKPNSIQFEKKAYWRIIIQDLAKAHNNVCAYSAHWLPPGITNMTVDHYKSKSDYPQLAYEWSNSG